MRSWQRRRMERSFTGAAGRKGHSDIRRGMHAVRNAEGNLECFVTNKRDITERKLFEQAEAAGCDAYIVKPINTRKLAEQVFSVVERLK
jgi:AmiR/NasT family two-component response regulator